MDMPLTIDGIGKTLAGKGYRLIKAEFLKVERRFDPIFRGILVDTQRSEPDKPFTVETDEGETHETLAEKVIQAEEASHLVES